MPSKIDRNSGALTSSVIALVCSSVMESARTREKKPSKFNYFRLFVTIESPRSFWRRGNRQLSNINFKLIERQWNELEGIEILSKACSKINISKSWKSMQRAQLAIKTVPLFLPWNKILSTQKTFFLKLDLLWLSGLRLGNNCPSLWVYSPIPPRNWQITSWLVYPHESTE